MPATETDYSKIKTYKEAAAAKATKASTTEAASSTLGDTIMKAVREDRASRGVSKIATDVGNVMGQMVTDPTGIRERTSGVVDPFSVNALTSQARAQNLRTLGTISTQQAQQEGTIQEIIQAGANQLKARAQKLAAQAQEDIARASALEDEWRMGYQEKQLGLEERKFAADEAYRQQQLQLEWEKLNRDTGSGMGFDDFLKLYNALKPSAGQEEKATQAASGLASLNIAKEIIDRNPNALKTSKLGIFSFIGGNDSITLKKSLENAADIITRSRTGAQLNKTEEEFYSRFVLDPVTVFSGMGEEDFENSFKILSSIFEKSISVGRDPREILTGDVSNVLQDNDPLGIR